MKRIASVLLVLGVGAVGASPFYFQTGIGTNSSGTIGVGTEVYRSGKFSVDLQTDYTQTGTTDGKHTEVVVLNTPDPVPQPTPVVINIPPKIDDVKDLFPQPPIVEIDLTIPLFPVIVKPEPDPPPQPPPDPPVAVVDPPKVQLNSVKRVAPGSTTQTTWPTMSNKLFSISVNPKVRINRFLWLNFKFGAEKQMMEGEIEKKKFNGSFLEWQSDEKINDNTVNYLLGAGAQFFFRYQLAGYIAADYRGLQGDIDGYNFDTDNVMITTGLRFKY